MKRHRALAFLLLAFVATPVISAEPTSLLKSPTKTFSTTTTTLPPRPTLEEQVAALAALVAQQQSQINSLQQQLTDQGSAIEMQISESEAISDRVTAFEQVFDFTDGVLTINFTAIEISADAVSVSAPTVEFDAQVEIHGNLEAGSITTESIDAELYAPGAGNVL
ncbi:hypothetical protein NZK35_12250 [Stieleria sp. ICT_E10.1]|uniref:hypothetical protein n=1 Tax=Stieleria sedimenti TaxID=2976331 RepID=UPI00217F410A|nr:hypothetical protein [Stieleria sedimenti]MCS7467417.1 hypothetical protein [Stieleria sedimenti]